MGGGAILFFLEINSASAFVFGQVHSVIDLSHVEQYIPSMIS